MKFCVSRARQVADAAVGRCKKKTIVKSWSGCERREDVFPTFSRRHWEWHENKLQLSQVIK